MGKRSRERRRQEQRAGGGYGGQPLRELTAEGIEAALGEAALAHRRSDLAGLDRVTGALVLAWESSARLVPSAVGACLERAVRRAWSQGWQPADVVRVLRRGPAVELVGLTIDVIAADAETYRHRPVVDRRWMSQLDDLGAQRWWDPTTPLLAAWAARHRHDRLQVINEAAALLDRLWQLPQLTCLGPPPADWGRPGSGPAPAASSSSIDAKILTRVRALLAKAESTEFVNEAEALTAKAHQLIARHAIDRAMLETGTDGSEPPIGRRLAVDDPYAAAKASLLSLVADAGRGRAVWSKQLGFSTVLGFAADLDAIELLYTSLLVQSTGAMVAAGGASGAADRRSRGFRSAFLTAYAVRVGQRLAESREASVAEAESTHGASLLPVLASREKAVEALVDEMFPKLHKGRRSASYDGAGWAAGVAAADRADLAADARLESTVARPGLPSRATA